MILKQTFYNRPTLQAAQDLLGCFLVRKINNKIIKAKIVEVEAYNGPDDLASHASRGKTQRNQVMFGPAGIIYVYLIYGMHYMLNIVTEKENYPAAILIRAVKPISFNQQSTIINRQFSGPARLTKALRIGKSFNGLPVYTTKHGLWVESRKIKIKPREIKKTARIGVDYAKEYKYKLWRFYLNNS